MDSSDGPCRPHDSVRWPIVQALTMLLRASRRLTGLRKRRRWVRFAHPPMSLHPVAWRCMALHPVARRHAHRWCRIFKTTTRTRPASAAEHRSPARRWVRFAQPTNPLHGVAPGCTTLHGVARRHGSASNFARSSIIQLSKSYRCYAPPGTTVRRCATTRTHRVRLSACAPRGLLTNPNPRMTTHAHP